MPLKPLADFVTEREAAAPLAEASIAVAEAAEAAGRTRVQQAVDLAMVLTPDEIAAMLGAVARKRGDARLRRAARAAAIGARGRGRPAHDDGSAELEMRARLAAGERYQAVLADVAARVARDTGVDRRSVRKRLCRKVPHHAGQK
jgi:hypothetical protein